MAAVEAWCLLNASLLILSIANLNNFLPFTRCPSFPMNSSSPHFRHPKLSEQMSDIPPLGFVSGQQDIQGPKQMFYNYTSSGRQPINTPFTLSLHPGVLVVSEAAQ